MTPGSERITVMHGRIVSGRGGGPEKTILNSPRFLAHTRWRELALYLHAPGDPGIEELRAKAAELDCPFFAIPERGPIELQFHPNQEGKPDNLYFKNVYIKELP